jgi:phosphoribosylaminoimidazole (AIR) synthetase
MRLFGALGGLEADEIRATFNGGLGMIAVVAPEALEVTLAAFDQAGLAGSLVGEVVPAGELGGRYAEGPLSGGVE